MYVDCSMYIRHLETEHTPSGHPEAWTQLWLEVVLVTVLKQNEHKIDVYLSLSYMKLSELRPFQFDVLFHEYADSVFCQNDL